MYKFLSNLFFFDLSDPTKFFGFELGALTKCEPQADRWIVNGKREAEDLAKVLDTFIERFVLCSKCGNPETTMDVRRDSIILNCRACGATTPVEMTHRLSTYVLKNPPEYSSLAFSLFVFSFHFLVDLEGRRP